MTPIFAAASVSFDRAVMTRLEGCPSFLWALWGGIASRPLPTFSFPSFTGCIAGVAGGLRFGFSRCLPCNPIRIFGFAGLSFGLQSDLSRGELGCLRGGKVSSVPSFRGHSGSLPLGNTSIASPASLVPSRPALGSCGAIGGSFRADGALQLGLLRVCRRAQAISKIGALGLVHLILVTGGRRPSCGCCKKWGLRGLNTIAVRIPFLPRP
jgi:hypothetical protein